MDDIVKHGKVKRGYIGISLSTVDAGTAEAFGLDRPKGVLINAILPNTPAAKANLEEGDIILSVEWSTRQSLQPTPEPGSPQTPGRHCNTHRAAQHRKFDRTRHPG